jgi:biotin carboxyl carrier protein
MKTYNITVNGVTYTVEVEEVGAGAAVAAPAAAPVAAPAPAAAPAPKAAPAAPKASGAAGAVSVKAPMPGNIMKVNCKAGASVKKGDVLIVLEAMKMENDICAPQDGVVASVEVAQGATVETDAVLVTLN